MGKGSGTIALVVTFVLVLFAAQRIGGIEWQLALILLTGGALAAWFASSVGKRATRRSSGATSSGTAAVVRILAGAFAIACMVVGGLWLVDRVA